jgi:hypothetical protein
LLGLLDYDVGHDHSFAAHHALMPRRDGQELDPVPLGVADELQQAGVFDHDVVDLENHFHFAVSALIATAGALSQLQHRALIQQL